MWPVTFVVGFGPCQLFQHLSTSRRCPTIIQPVLTPRKLACNTLAKYVSLYAQTPAHLRLLILRVVLPIDLARRCLVRHAERGIADLRWKVVFEVEETRLAYVARLCAGLADHRRFEAHACARVPAEDSERTCAGSAFSPELLL
jgi:hypothetical protein